MYDLIIIGAGPAGITASIYAARKKMNFLVISKDIGGQTNWTKNIENYTGYLFITGDDLVKKFSEHLKRFNIQIKEFESVTAVEKEEDFIKVITEKNEYKTKAVIIASGRTPRKLGVKGEEEFRNKGVAYCATCDAPMFAGKDVLVVGGGNAAIDAAIQLMKIANKVYIADIDSQLKADPIMVEKIKNNEKVRIYNNSSLKEIYGEKLVSGVKLDIKGKTSDLKVQGVFIEAGSVASSNFTKGVLKNEAGEIFVDCGCRTNIEGIFACGDVTNVPAKQIVTACGEGTKATLSAFNYITRKK
ncbi:MAG: FAD-dependent oxidoreductase [Endomicrobiales bacterium]|nr:FAD-dependent oxidoreductase [Endomicrobiales bacterium]